MRSWTAIAVPVGLTAIPEDQVVSGAPRSGWTALDDHGSVGVWEITEGTSSDVEEDEYSVVLAGRGTLTINGDETIQLAPGVVFRLDHGDRTVWAIESPVRKVFFLTGTKEVAR